VSRDPADRGIALYIQYVYIYIYKGNDRGHRLIPAASAVLALQWSNGLLSAARPATVAIGRASGNMNIQFDLIFILWYHTSYWRPQHDILFSIEIHCKWFQTKINVAKLYFKIIMLVNYIGPKNSHSSDVIYLFFIHVTLPF